MEVSYVVLKLVPFSGEASCFCLRLLLAPVGSSSAGWTPSEAMLIISVRTNWNNNVSAKLILTYWSMASLVCVCV